MSFEEELTREVKSEVSQKGRIEIETRFFPLAWFLHFVTPVIEIDGKSVKRKWGVSHFDLEPGLHQVKIYFSYFMMSECGANRIRIKVEEGKTKKVTYYMPPWMLAKGRMKLNN